MLIVTGRAQKEMGFLYRSFIRYIRKSIDYSRRPHSDLIRECKENEQVSIFF